MTTEAATSEALWEMEGADTGQKEQSGAENAEGGAVCVPLNLSDTAATSQDGSSLEFIAPLQVGRTIFRMQVAEGCGLHEQAAGTVLQRELLIISLSHDLSSE